MGSRVHYVSHGSPINQDGSQAYISQCRAATVTEVLNPGLTDTVGLSGMFSNRTVAHDEAGKADGTWHWPEEA